MISYNDFLDRVRDHLPEYLPQSCSGADIQVMRTRKYLSESYDGICIKPEGSEVGICMNLHPVYMNYHDDEEFEMVMRSVASDVVAAMNDGPEDLELVINDIDFFVDHVMVQLVDYGDIDSIRDDIPFRKCDSMAMIYRLMLPQNDDGVLTTVVTNSLIRNFNMSEDELFARIMKTLPDRNPIEFKFFNELIAEAGCNELYRGAGCLMYPDFAEKACEAMGGSFYILPFSVHSLLLIRDIGDISREFLNDIAFRCSTYSTVPEDRLTKEIYYCNSKDMAIRRAV